MTAETIVVIDDNPANLDLLTMLLRSLGYDVRGERNGELGLLAVERLRPALLLTDIALPDIDGYAILGAIRARPEFAAMPVVAVTAQAMPGDEERGGAAGFDGYLTKPIDIDAMPRQLALARQRRRRARDPV